MAVYLDHAASTGVRAEVTQLLTQLLSETGNPSAVHGFGQAAKMRLEQAREDVAKALNCDRNEVLFTSGGTEANNLAVLGLFEARNQGAERPLIYLLGTEHHAVLEPAENLEKLGKAELQIIPVDGQGRVDLKWLETQLDLNSDRVALVCAIWANNETGAVLDLAKIGQICKRLHIPLHTDAVAAVGHMAVDFAESCASTLAFTGHKLGAPIGTGALLVGRGVKLSSRSFGGSQERGLRAGTQDAVGAATLALALTQALKQLSHQQSTWEDLRSKLIAGTQATVPDVIVVGDQLSQNDRIPNIVNLVFPGCLGESLLFLLDSAGVAISNGSACTAGVVGGSHVLLAMGFSPKEAASCVRISFGHSTTEADIDAFLAALPGAHAKALKAGFN